MFGSATYHQVGAGCGQWLPRRHRQAEGFRQPHGVKEEHIHAILVEKAVLKSLRKGLGDRVEIIPQGTRLRPRQDPW